jgi:murein DD-endopeptidase MepM/ murein hydrolase activator NlpD
MALKMKAPLLLILIFVASWKSAFPGNDPTRIPDSLKPYKIITKAKLVHLIDSVFDLNDVSAKDIDLLNYYANVLKNSKTDSVKISDFNLMELSFYSQKDEQMLFPPVKLESIPINQDLIIENSFMGNYCSPKQGVVTSNYGWRDNRLHKGIDIDLEKGDRVHAAFPGKVRFARRQGGFGNVVILMHLNGLETVYAHLSRIRVKEGEIVQSGQTIGLGGNTGESRGTHLHFEVRYKGHALNPGAIISFTENKLHYHTITLKNTKHNLCAFPNNSNLHKVNKGESWLAIASKYGLSLKELLTLNGVEKRYYLKPGQQLRIN